MLEIREICQNISNGKGYCNYVEPGEFNSFSKDVKAAINTKEHSDRRIAVAVLHNSFAIKIVADIYLKLNKPINPTKLFRNRKEAVKWLRIQRDKYNTSSN